MNFYIVIPAHNEADFIGKTIHSLVQQTLLPKKIVVVNDHSTDDTEAIVNSFIKEYSWISIVNIQSSEKHLPGSKIVNAFQKGLDSLDHNFDVICKFDADLIFPKNYLEQLAFHFKNNPKLGMAAGLCYIEKNNTWVLENLTNKEHIRGALKAYKKDCFKAIGGLKPSMGWDTIDELLAQYHSWQILTDDTLHVKHLKPTGSTYNKAAKFLQGEALYKMRYGFWLTLITGLKLSLKKKKPALFYDYLRGFFKAKREQQVFLVSESEGKFIRRLRWLGIRQKLF